MTTTPTNLLRICWVLLAALLIVPNSTAAHTIRPAQAEPGGTAQLSDDGWDDRFGAPGVYDGSVVASAVSAAGDLYVAGSFRSNESSVPANHIARWDGRRWYPLGAGVSGDLERVRQLATHSTNVYAVGAFTQAGDVAANQIARWDGVAWHALGSGLGPQLSDEFGTSPGKLYAVATAPDGDVYVAGNFNQIDGVPANGVARWDGTAWHPLGEGITERGIGGGEERFPAWVYALTVAPDGMLYAGGQFSDAGQIIARNIARWDGASWHPLGAGVSGGGFLNAGQVDAIAVDGTEVYAGGIFTEAGGSPTANIAMWDGQAWSALGAGLFSGIDSPSPVLSLLINNGALYAGGTFTQAGGKAITALARWDGAQWSAVGGEFTASSRVMVYTLANAQTGGIFAGGVVDRAEGVDVNGIAHWNAKFWENLGQGVALAGDISAQVNAVAIDTDGLVYAGGMINTVGGLHVNNIGMWDGQRWHDVGGGVTPGVDGVIHAMLAVGTDLYVAGIFTQAGGKSANRIAKWSRTTGEWTPLGAGIDGTVYALAYGDGVLYAGGSFTRAGGSEALDIAAWDGTSWQGLGGEHEIFEVLDSGNEAGTFVRALAYHNGELLIGGHFQTIHLKGASTQDPSSYVYVHNLIGYVPATQGWFTIGEGGAMGVTTNGFSGFSTTVYALAAVNGGLYIGGSFNRGGGLLTPNLARWDLATGAWTSPGVPTSTGDVHVYALAGLGTQLLVGGTFTAVDAVQARSVALFNTDTGVWDALGSGLGWKNGVPRAYSLALRADGASIGGQINQAGPHPSVGIAHYSGEFGGGPPPEMKYRASLPFVARP
jgi:hypothetical protein